MYDVNFNDLGQLTDYDKYEIEQRKADSLLIISKNKEAAIHLKMQ